MHEYYFNIYHSGVAHDEDPPGRGSGRYPYGSGKRPHQDKEPSKALRALKGIVSTTAKVALMTAISLIGSQYVAPVIAPHISSLISKVIGSQVVTQTAGQSGINMINSLFSSTNIPNIGSFNNDIWKSFNIQTRIHSGPIPLIGKKIPNYFI